MRDPMSWSFTVFRAFGIPVKIHLLFIVVTLGLFLRQIGGKHNPLLWYDVLFFSFAFQFLITWLFNRTGGSVLPPMLFHLTSNVVGGALIIPMFVGADFEHYYVLFIACACLLAIVLNAPRGWAMGRRYLRGYQSLST